MELFINPSLLLTVVDTSTIIKGIETTFIMKNIAFTTEQREEIYDLVLGWWLL